MLKSFKKLLALLLLISQVVNSEQDFNNIKITTDDKIKIHAVYQLPKPLKDKTLKHPAIILIHQGGSSHKEWLDLGLVDKLVSEGFALLAYDVRMHGESGKDNGDIYDLFNNPKRAPKDLQAVIGFLNKDKNIDSSRIGILGASIGANLAAVAGASDHYNIKSIVSLSAKTQAVINLSGEEKYSNPNNGFYIASKNEQDGLRDKWAHELYDNTTGMKKVTIAEGDKHGSYILKDNPVLQDSIVEWFKSTLHSEIKIKTETKISNENYDTELAIRLGADDYGMKSYIFVILKSGENKSSDQEVRNKSFRGHMNNMRRLVDENKLLLTGPFGNNEQDFRGLFILNVKTLKEAKTLLATDPAINAGYLKAEMYEWYGSAAISEYLEASDKIWKIKP